MNTELVVCWRGDLWRDDRAVPIAPMPDLPKVNRGGLYHVPIAQDRIRAALADGSVLSLAAIQQRTNLGPGTITTLLTRLVAKGQVDRVRLGGYRIQKTERVWA